MIDVKPEDVTTLFPEFADVETERIQFYIDTAMDYVNEGRWGTQKARRGVLLMTAHMMSRAGVLDGTDGAGNILGAVLSESVGGISTTYASPSGSTDGSALGLTSYGEQFNMLRRTVIKTPLCT